MQATNLNLILLALFAFVAPHVACADHFEIKTNLPLHWNTSTSDWSKQDQEGLARKVQMTLDSFEIFCKRMSWPCDSFDDLKIDLTDRDIKNEDGSSLAGKFSPASGTVEVSIRSEDLEQTLFHELTHWAHFNHLGKPDWFVAPPAALEWVLEAVPFLAMLKNKIIDDTLTGAEKLFLARDLSGSLLNARGSSAWYGLIGLWCRYLDFHVVQSDLILSRLSDMTPETLIREGSNQFSSLGLEFLKFRGNTQDELPKINKKFQNLFEYFILALNQNSTGMNLWNLFQLGGDVSHARIQAESSRWVSANTDAIFSVGALDFFYLLPQTLPKGAHLEISNGLRVIFWRGATQPDVDLVQAGMPSEFNGWDRIMVYNPTRSELKLKVVP